MERELFAVFTIHEIISLLRSYRILLKQRDIGYDGVCRVGSVCVCTFSLGRDNIFMQTH